MNIALKFVVLGAMFLLAMLVAGLYGALHNQISYSISPEYFTLFKFEQFDVTWGYEYPRLGAAYVGFAATWWMGKWVFTFLGPVGLIYKTPKQMLVQLSKSFLVVAVVALLTGLLGLAYISIEVTEHNIAQHMEWVFDGVTDPVAFVRVGFMHDASYYGAQTGLAAGIAYLLGIKGWQCYNKAQQPTVKSVT